ncbi:hypothetical protein [Enterovirga aerilata]|uniref:Uncharacterized protein n=1 Tax=Enterovirga aerilata TaxID=2730920 RepID=A0A849IEI2_9HYPH|nr:hypothetical protein [Enterovirga sp. DB1703]NNM72273.1 hypothetical protein [Enterovirga sp. DB1703]
MAREGLALVSAGAETLEEAHEIAGRLTQAGFARNGIRIVRRAEDLFEVSLRVRERSRAKAERAIGNRFGGVELPAVPGTRAALALGLGVALLGAGIYAALAARKMVPRYLRGAGQEPAAAPPEE